MPTVNFAGVEEAQDFSPLPEGPYLCALKAIDDTKETQAGDEMWELKFVVVEGDFAGRSIYDRISFGKKALSRVKLLCSRMGLDVSGDLNVTPDLLKGKQVWVTVEIEDYTDSKGQDRKRNSVPFAGFMEASAQGGATGSPARASLAEPDDDLPFAPLRLTNPAMCW